jgi:hypothetical protein
MKNLVVPKKEIEMFTAVSETLNHYSGKLSRNKKFIKNINKLTELLTEIKDLQKQFDSDISEYEINKLQFRKELIQKVTPIAKILTLYSFIKKDQKIHKKHNLNIEEFNKISDSRLIKYVKSIWTDANKLVGLNFNVLKNINTKKIEKKYKKSIDLGESFGLSQSEVQEMDQLTGKFVNSLILFDSKAREKKKTYKELIGKCIKVETILTKKADKYASFFEVEDENYFKKYINARGKNIKLSSKNEKKLKSSIKELKKKISVN